MSGAAAFAILANPTQAASAVGDVGEIPQGTLGIPISYPLS